MLVPRSRCLARFDTTPELVAECLHLPKTAAICDIRMNGLCIEVMVDDSELPEVPEGSIVPKRVPQLTQREVDRPAVEIDWDWGGRTI